MKDNKEMIETIKATIKIMKLNIIKKMDKLDELLDSMSESK